jgi:DNA polymerase III subunit delta
VKLKTNEIASFLKKLPPHVRAVLVYGPDEGLARERVVLLAKNAGVDPADPFGLADIPGEALKEDPARLLDEAKSLSLLGGARAVRVRGGDDRTVAAAAKDALAALAPGDNLVLIEAGDLNPRSALRLLFEAAPNAAALPCYVEEAESIAAVLGGVLREQGYRISSDALSLLASSASGDRAAARGEVEKLMLYMGPMKDIGLDDVEACCAVTTMKTEDIARHAASGRFAEADRLMAFAFSEGDNPVALLRAMQSHFLRLHMVAGRLARGEGMDEALKRLRPALFFKQRPDFESQLRRLSPHHAEQALSVLATAEARCKRTGADGELTARRALLAVSQMAARAGRR